jgi:hypothetical protein
MQIRFSLETKYGTYSDALNLPDDHTFSDAEIEAMKIQRRDNWVAHIDSTQTAQAEPPVENTEETPVENPTE